MKRLFGNNYIKVQFMSPVSELLEMEQKRKSWGLSITSADGDRTAFVSLGDKEDFEKLLVRMGDDPVKFTIFCLKDTTDEIADELFTTIVEEEEGFILNGDHVTSEDFTLCFGSFGEKEGKRLKREKDEIEDVVEVVHRVDSYE